MSEKVVGLERKTILSPCRTYRYQLWREWELPADETREFGPHLGVAAFIGLNPSTADETKDDATIRKCIGFAKRWGCTALCMVNLFAYRSRNPKLLLNNPDPVGPENDDYLREVSWGAPLVIAAWGAFPQFDARARAVERLFVDLKCLGMSRGGFPRHPLMLPYKTRLQQWSRPTPSQVPGPTGEREK